MSRNPDPVELVGHGTRELVLEAAARLFQERGYGSVSIRDIGAAVGISTSTLYHHFADKREILFAITVRFMVEFNREMADAASIVGSPSQRLVNVAIRHVGFQHARRHHLFTGQHFRRVLDTEQRATTLGMMREYRDIVRDIVVDGVDRHEFVVTDVDIAVSSILDMLNGIREWYSEDGRHAIEPLARIYADTCLRICGVGVVRATSLVNGRLSPVPYDGAEPRGS